MAKNNNLSKTLAKRILAIIIIGVFSVMGMLKFGPKIGSFFGLISVNRGATLKPPEANTPPPIFLDVPKAVNKTKIDLRGVSAPKTKIELFVNGPKEAEVLTDMSGEFLFTDVKLNKGKNTVFAKADDTKSEILTIQYDNEPPKIEIETPTHGETIENLNERVEISGTINEKAKIRVNGRVAVQRPDNSFSFLLGVDEGEVGIKVTAVDLAGNETSKEIAITYQKD